MSYTYQSTPAQPTGALTPPASRYSDLGQVAGGDSEPAGTDLPATSGRVIPVPGAIARILITGTAATQGDGVLVTYEGRRTAFPDNPASRILSAAGPGASGVNVIPDGTIEIVLNNSNSDLNYVNWVLTKRPV